MKIFIDLDIEKKNTKNQKTDIFVVDQLKWFKLDTDIYCEVYSNKESIESGTKKIVNNIETINIEIFSYKKSLKELIEYIDNLTTNYVTQIQNVRINKKFIYTYLGIPKERNECDDKYSYWEECEFKSFRTFDNLFFDSKQKLLDKLNFYKNNEDWYRNEGHPYTFGVGLTGPPGTGKTSIIKCIANMLNRHLIVIPLNKIKTQREFSECFFEKRYNRNNEHDSILFSNKIIVFEDIDCMTDIVKQRKENMSSLFSNANIIEDTEEDTEEDIESDIEGDIERNTEENKKELLSIKLLKNISKKLNNPSQFLTMLNNPNDDKITLSFLLNIIDGIRETPGRILIITSNNYKSLDNALVRPGRIDFTLEMGNASINTIKAMFFHYYNYELPEKIISRLKENIISPAQLVSIRLESTSGSDFINNLLKFIK